MSNEAKFTAGPWEVTTEISMNDRTVCKLTENTLITSNCYVSEDLKADAHLIAAAPEMYTELEGAVEILEELHNDMGCFTAHAFDDADLDSLKSILAKARGDNNEQ